LRKEAEQAHQANRLIDRLEQIAKNIAEEVEKNEQIKVHGI
jgi:hypothetical protein